MKNESELGYPIAELDNPKEREKVDGNSAKEQAAIDRVLEWWELDFESKTKISREFADVYRQYRGEHWDMYGPDGEILRDSNQKAARPNSVENITFALVESLKNEFSQEPELIDYPTEPGDEPVARKMTELKMYLMYKNRIIDEFAKFLHNFFWYGTGIWQLRWDPAWRTGTGPNMVIGDIRWESVHPQVMYPDHRCGVNIDDGFRVHKAVYRPVEYIRDNYPGRGHLVKPDTMTRMDILGVAPGESWEDGTTGEESIGGVTMLVETWYRGRPLILGKGEKDQGDGLHKITWAGATQGVYLSHSNYVYYQPGETPKFPFIFRPCYPRENSPWGLGEAFMLKNQQIVLNKISEIIIEAGMYQGIGQTLYEPGSLTQKQKDNIEQNGSIPGMWFEVADTSRVQRLYGQGVPPSLINEIQRRQRTMESIIGRHDVTQGKTPGSVTAFRALNLLAQRAQVRLRLKEQAVKTAFEDASKLANRLIALYYDEPRKYRIIGPKDEERPQYGKFEPSQIRRVWDRSSPTMTVLPKQDFIPMPGKEYEEYVPELDTICRVSQAMPTDRLFLMELAKELYSGQLLSPKTFFHVIQYGAFPPWETVAQEVQDLFDKAQASQAAGPASAAPPGAAAGGGEQVEITAEMVQFALSQMTPEQQAQFARLDEEEQVAIIQELAAEAGPAPGGGPVAAQ